MLAWQDFLHAQYLAQTPSNTINALTLNNNALIALEQFAVLTFSGSDAASFLQGQISANIHEVSDTQSRFTALCDAKAKVIATFLVIKRNSDYLILLPKVLLDTIKTRLQRYILRAKVSIVDNSETYCVMAWSTPENTNLFSTRQSDTYQAIHFINYELIITQPAHAIELWQEKLTQGFQMQSSNHWLYSNILAGIVWLDLNTSEQFIPQMLNIDKLGGISFNKGCYTGQEIIARTHYLGKVNRSLLLAEVITSNNLQSGDMIINEQKHTIGKIMSLQLIDTMRWVLLLVLTNSETERKLYLSDNSELRLLESNFC